MAQEGDTDGMSNQSTGTGPGSTGLSRIVDSVLPGQDSRLDRLSSSLHQALHSLTAVAPRPVFHVLHGNEWLGHPAHPVVIAVPVGAWVATGWYDARSAMTKDPRDEHVADGALRVGIAGAVLAAATGATQYLDTRDGARREAAVHAGLNTVALGLYAASWAARVRGSRRRGRRLAAAGLAIVSASGYLGGDLAYRLGVGVRPQALRSPAAPARATSAEPIEGGDARHS